MIRTILFDLLELACLASFVAFIALMASGARAETGAQNSLTLTHCFAAPDGHEIPCDILRSMLSPACPANACILDGTPAYGRAWPSCDPDRRLVMDAETRQPMCAKDMEPAK